MKKLKLNLWFAMLATIAVTAMIVASCNKKFDEPPGFVNPNIKSNITVSAFKAKYPASTNLMQVTGNDTLSGVVVGDDKSGNIYKQIFIQDATGGISIQLDRANLYNDYPVGRKVNIIAKGLYVGNYHGLVQIGLSNTSQTNTIAGIPSTLFSNYIIKDTTYSRAYVDSTLAQKVTYSQLTSSAAALQSMLIRMENIEIDKADTSLTYSDTSAQKNSVRIHFGPGCGTGSTTSTYMYNSAYANFAPLKLPKGNGTLFGILVPYNNDKELMIRDTADVKLYNTRCGGGGPVGNLTIKTIQEIRALGDGGAIPANTGIEGVIVSDRSNEAAGNYRIQDASGYGIQLRFTTAGNGNFNLGDKLRVDISSLVVELYNGDLQINNVASASSLGTGTITPRVTTVADINTNKNNWASTVVTISNAAITTGTSNSTGVNYTFTDASGGIASFVRTTMGYTPPTNAATITGYVSLFNGTPQLTLRKSTDVVAGGTPPPVGGGGITLTTSPKLLDFNSISSGLPSGVSVYREPTSTALGTAATLTSAATRWAITSGGFYNFASATGLSATTSEADQGSSTNRALGVRQVSATNASFPNSDPGVAFVFQIDNTTGKTGLKLDFLLQSLDNTSARTTTWTVDYAVGDNPTSFTPISATGTLTTGNSSFSSTPINVNFGSALDNKSTKVWIRIVTLTATTGTGNRASTAVDDVKFTWN